MSLNEMTASKVYFYVPSEKLVSEVPVNIVDYWNWINEIILRAPAPLSDGRGFCTWTGPYNWTIQTFIYLSSNCFSCKLTASLPDEGIVIAHSDFVSNSFRPSSNTFIAEIKPDRSLRCKFANFVIVQNKHDPIVENPFVKSAFVNYWPQPGLIARDPKRGARFKNICFMGNPKQFIQETDALAHGISKLGLNWIMVPRKMWNDYRQVDCVVAVRPPEPRTPDVWDSAQFSLNRKPATKLYNAWMAGVPAILSPDIAFQDIKESELDFLEARDVPEILERIKLLVSNADLRRSIVENGKRRAKEFEVSKTVQRWIEILEQQIIPEYVRWSRSAFRRWSFFRTRSRHWKNFGKWTWT